MFIRLLETKPRPSSSSGDSSPCLRRCRQRARSVNTGAMAEHYDVIIIGSGAGGGTLAHTLAPSGQADPAARTGQLPAARDGRTGTRSPCSSTAATSRRTRGTTPTATAFQPQVHYFVGGATKLYGAALYRLRPQDFGELQHVDGLSPAWPLTYDDFEPYYTKAEWLYQVHGNHGEDPTEGHWSKQYPWPAVSHEPRIQELVRRPRSPAATTRSTRRAASCSTRPTGPTSTCIRCTWCDGYPCLVHAKSDAETIAVRPMLDLPERDAARRRRGHASSRPTQPGRTVTGVVVVARRQRRRCTRPTSSWCRPAPRTAPSSCCARRTTATRTAWPTAPTRSAGTTCSTTARPSSRSSKELNETVFQKTLGINDFYFGADDYEWPVGNIQMVGKSNAEAMKGEEPKLTEARAALEPRPTSPSTPSTSGSPPRTSRCPRTA